MSGNFNGRTYDLLQERGVSIGDLVNLVYNEQSRYLPDITKDECFASLHSVLLKREVQNAIMTGIALDKLAEQGALPADLEAQLMHDEALYGIDEILALSIVNLFGSIALTNFGYFDKVKPCVIGELDSNHEEGRCNTFLDDLVGAVVASACARLAHRHGGVPNDSL